MSLKSKYETILSKLKSKIESTPTISSEKIPVWIGGKIPIEEPTSVFIVPTPIRLEPITIEPTRTCTVEFEIAVVKKIKETSASALSQAEKDTALLACEIVDTLHSDITLEDTVRELRVTTIAPVYELIGDYRVFGASITVELLFEL